MLETISKILLGHYCVLALALQVFLARGGIDARRRGHWRRHKARKGKRARATPAAEPEPSPDQPADPHARLPDNVVTFRRDC